MCRAGFSGIEASCSLAAHLSDFEVETLRNTYGGGGARISHLAPGHGRVDWSAVFNKAAEIRFPGHMCLETPPFAQGPEYTNVSWKQMVDECEKLVEAP